MGDPAGALPTLGWGSVAMSLASLGVVCVLAYVALRWLAGRGVGRATGAIKVLARCPLEPRRSVYLIETAGRCFLVGVGDGPMSLLAEVDRSLDPSADADRDRERCTRPSQGRRSPSVLARCPLVARPSPRHDRSRGRWWCCSRWRRCRWCRSRC